MANMTSIEILGHLVGFDTTSRNSNLELIDWVEDYLNSFGVSCERIFNAEKTKANLWASIGLTDSQGYVLSGHTDVVPVDNQDWATDPFILTQSDGKLYGRGSCDMKGFIACCLAAVPQMLEANLVEPIHLAFSFDEEVGCKGIPLLLNKIANRPLVPKICFVGEPTDMNVVLGHKAKRSFEVTVKGFSCHSSLAPLGVNAVEYAARLISHIHGIGQRLRNNGRHDPLYDVAWTTAHTGTITGGTVLNIVPDKCVFRFEFRALPEDDVDGLVAEVKTWARDVLEREMRAVSPDAGISFEWISNFPGLSTNEDNQSVLIAKRLAKRNSHGKVAYGTEAGLFVDIAGIDTVVIGPGSIEQAHKPDEYVKISELDKCDEFLNQLVKYASSSKEVRHVT